MIKVKWEVCGLEEDDDKFVRATSDDKTRDERLQQLTKSRLTLSKVTIVQTVLFLLLMFLDLIWYLTSKEKRNWLSDGTLVMGGGAIIYCVTFFYLDLQVKFLKAIPN